MRAIKTAYIHMLSRTNCEETEAEEKVEQEEKEESTQDFGVTADGVPRKSRGARNAKLRRLCQRRKNGSLAVPTWLHELWKSGDHSALSLQYEDAGYNKDHILYSVYIVGSE